MRPSPDASARPAASCSGRPTRPNSATARPPPTASSRRPGTPGTSAGRPVARAADRPPRSRPRSARSPRARTAAARSGSRRAAAVSSASNRRAAACPTRPTRTRAAGLSPMVRSHGRYAMRPSCSTSWRARIPATRSRHRPSRPRSSKRPSANRKAFGSACSSPATSGSIPRSSLRSRGRLVSSALSAIACNRPRST